MIPDHGIHRVKTDSFSWDMRKLGLITFILTTTPLPVQSATQSASQSSTQSNTQGPPAIIRMGLHTGSADSPDTDLKWQSFSLSYKQTHLVATEPQPQKPTFQSSISKIPLFQTGISGGFLRTSETSGLADTWLKAARLGQNRHLKHWWDLGGRIKIPTADSEKGLGTGAFEAEVNLQALGSFDGWVPWYRLAFRYRDESSQIDTRNGWIGSTGISYQSWQWMYQISQPSQQEGVTRQWMSLGHSFRLPSSLGNKICSAYMSMSKGRYQSLGAGFSIKL